jgi:hypothetical protein
MAVVAERVRAILAGNGQLREVRMFGGLCFMLNGKHGRRSLEARRSRPGRQGAARTRFGAAGRATDGNGGPHDGGLYRRRPAAEGGPSFARMARASGRFRPDPAGKAAEIERTAEQGEVVAPGPCERNHPPAVLRLQTKMNQSGRSRMISIFNGIKELSGPFSMQPLLRRDIALVVSDLFQKPIELWPSVTAFGAADAFVGEFVDDQPSLSTSDCLGERLTLVIDGLPIFRRDPKVELGGEETCPSRRAIPKEISVWGFYSDLRTRSLTSAAPRWRPLPTAPSAIN